MFLGGLHLPLEYRDIFDSLSSSGSSSSRFESSSSSSSDVGSERVTRTWPREKAGYLNESLTISILHKVIHAISCERKKASLDLYPPDFHAYDYRSLRFPLTFRIPTSPRLSTSLAGFVPKGSVSVPVVDLS
ncbi:hypothetical protein M413DRAFT_32174 [Hebeloma cylindrosporum]|uniref:Uncharacterized protein n=1 Tax=Hebeloma cylindrosporum TaxID=76867 RepID=A0A0C3BWP9_HEBCY|nr:hypothetical protein M413DRAFT_32174 [Hebeloma cylindrosporum h7]